MQGTESGRGEHQAVCAKPVGEQDVFSSQEGVAASLQAWLAACTCYLKLQLYVTTGILNQYK